MNREARTARRRKVRTVERGGTIQREDGSVQAVEVARETSAEMAEAAFVSAELAREFKGSVNFYKSEYGGSKPHAEAVEEAGSMNGWLRRKVSEGMPAKEIGWSELSALAEVSLDDSLAMWLRVKEAAENELEAGYRTAKVLGPRPSAWEMAQFLAIRDAFADEWQPRGGIEAAMIDMLATAFSLQMYWSSIAHERATSTHNEQRKEVARFESQGWKSPYQSEGDAIDQAHRLADGYNRQFLRVLRQLRDLRRYAPPVIVNNGGQVNVGQQQVNINTMAETDAA